MIDAPVGDWVRLPDGRVGQVWAVVGHKARATGLSKGIRLRRWLWADKPATGNRVWVAVSPEWVDVAVAELRSPGESEDVSMFDDEAVL